MSAPDYALRSESVRLAARTIEAAWLNQPTQHLADQAAQALADACMLQSPETATELARLRTELAARPAEAHVLRQAAAALEDEDQLGAAHRLLVMADQREHAAARRWWKGDAEAERLRAVVDDSAEQLRLRDARIAELEARLGESGRVAAPAVGDRYEHRVSGQIVVVTKVWAADDGHTAVAYEWQDDRPGLCGSACPIEVFRRTYRPAVDGPAPAVEPLVARWDRQVSHTPDGGVVVECVDASDPRRGVALVLGREYREALAAVLVDPNDDARELTVFRAEHTAFPLDTYTNLAAAKAHCEADERRAWVAGTPLTFGWIEDEDGVHELTVTAEGCDESATGYSVKPVPVASAYDEEGDE